MKYGMLSTLIPKELEFDFKTYSKNNMQDAASMLQWNLYNGFCENLRCEIPLFNVLPVGSFPQYYKKLFVKKSVFNNNSINIGFCNIKLLRNYFKTKNITIVLKKWCQKDNEPKTLFVYTLSQPLISAVCKIKKSFPNLTVCAIVADLPDMSSLSSDKSLLQKHFAKQRATDSYNKLNCIDRFVLLTKQMAEYMNISQPYMVMEGVVSNFTEAVIPVESPVKTIMYSGTLHKRFGMLHLLEAFKMIPNKNYRLVICGEGDSKEEIKNAALFDSRIEFLGQLTQSEVLSLQKRATVLVNPRQNNEEFTKYSFPSKTMEYLKSGVPVIAYKLDGIPDEYIPYLNSPENDSVKGLADAIVNVCSLSFEDRVIMGDRGRNFVCKNKSNIIQTKRILDFISTK